METDPKPKKYVRFGLIYGVPVALCVLLIVILNVTSPLQTGPAGILIVFGLLYAALSSVAYALLHMLSLILQLFGIKGFKASRHTYYLTSTIMLWPIFILALSTLGRLEVAEIVLVTLLVALGCFYIMRRVGLTIRV